MDYRIIEPGTLVIDNSFSPPTEEQLAAGRALGVVANMRYTSEPVNRNKNLTRAQAEAGWRVGVGALANQEQTHLDSHEGYEGGLRRGRSFIATAEAIGYPTSVPAIVSVDTSWHAEALNFVRAFDFVLRTAGWEQVGTYFFGPGPAEQLTQAGFGHDVLWQAHAGSYFVSFEGASQVARRLDAQVRKCPNRPGYEVISNLTHLYQEYGYVRLANGPFHPGQIDENHVRRPVRVWLPSNSGFPGQSGGGNQPGPTPAPVPTPTPTEDDPMLRLIRFGADSPALFLGATYQNGLIDTVRWCSPEMANAYAPHVGEILVVDAAAVFNTQCVGPAPAGFGFARVVDGTPGMPGLAGAPGRDGAPGAPGQQGPPGPAVDPQQVADNAVAIIKARL